MTELDVVGIGPGDVRGMTLEAREALERAELICGYTGYVRLVAPLVPQTPVLATGMMREAERCRAALDAAARGTRVAMVCSGDAGVYGMASPILELAEGYPGVRVRVIPGVSAAQSGAAVLGAPLGHDFATISLSDLLTDRSVIERRLRAAARADFCICLYNPRSRRRADMLSWAVGIMLEARDAATPCGWVRNIGRPGEEWGTLALGDLADLEADMLTTVFVGNSQTRLIDGRMVTPRGYGERGRFDAVPRGASAQADDRGDRGVSLQASDLQKSDLGIWEASVKTCKLDNLDDQGAAR